MLCKYLSVMGVEVIPLKHKREGPPRERLINAPSMRVCVKWMELTDKAVRETVRGILKNVIDKRLSICREDLGHRRCRGGIILPFRRFHDPI